jgi:hypothetical protein
LSAENMPLIFPVSSFFPCLSCLICWEHNTYFPVSSFVPCFSCLACWEYATYFPVSSFLSCLSCLVCLSFLPVNYGCALCMSLLPAYLSCLFFYLGSNGFSYFFCYFFADHDCLSSACLYSPWHVCRSFHRSYLSILITCCHVLLIAK